MVRLSLVTPRMCKNAHCTNGVMTKTRESVNLGLCTTMMTSISCSSAEPSGVPSRGPHFWTQFAGGNGCGLPSDGQSLPSEVTGWGWHSCRFRGLKTKHGGEVEAPSGFRHCTNGVMTKTRESVNLGLCTTMMTSIWTRFLWKTGLDTISSMYWMAVDECAPPILDNRLLNTGGEVDVTTATCYQWLRLCTPRCHQNLDAVGPHFWTCYQWLWSISLRFALRSRIWAQWCHQKVGCSWATPKMCTNGVMTKTRESVNLGLCTTMMTSIYLNLKLNSGNNRKKSANHIRP